MVSITGTNLILYKNEKSFLQRVIYLYFIITELSNFIGNLFVKNIVKKDFEEIYRILITGSSILYGDAT